MFLESGCTSGFGAARRENTTVDFYIFLAAVRVA